MQTIRRLYLYAVAFVSLEVVLWGVIGLVRLFFAGQQIGEDVGALAGALSLILVGVPVFLLHWWLAQRSAAADIEERSSRIRALFLYGGLLATLVPAAQNILAALSRGLVVVLGARPGMALLGGQQSFSDNLVAAVLNVLISVYLYYLLRLDWQQDLQGDAFSDLRRVYHYAWMLYGLAMLVFGISQLLTYLLGVAVTVGAAGQAVLANSLALLLVGGPLWWVGWSSIQKSLPVPDEMYSLLRLVILFVLSFAGAGVVLVAAGMILYEVFLSVLGQTRSISAFVGGISTPLSVGLPFAAIWAYYGRDLATLIRLSPGPRAASLRRLYNYVLTLAGLAAWCTGLYQLFSYLIDAGLLQNAVVSKGLSSTLAGGLAALLVGLPLWIFTWRPMLQEAAGEGEVGDHARRSPLRKAYLYLVLFASVVGLMVSAGMLLFELLSSLLGDPPRNMLADSLHLISLLLLFSVLLAYHSRALRADGRMAARALARRHSQYPVLLLAPDQGDFAQTIVDVLKREVSDLPIAVHPYSQGAPDETLSAAKAVILPAELSAKPNEALRVWLQGFTGQRLVVPTPVHGWRWISGSGRRLPLLAKQVARDVRQLAEGMEPGVPHDSSPWQVLLYVLAALFGLQLVLGMVSMLISLLQ